MQATSEFVEFNAIHSGTDIRVMDLDGPGATGAEGGIEMQSPLYKEQARSDESPVYLLPTCGP